MDDDPFLPDLLGSLEHPPPWVKAEILVLRIQDWPRWAHVAWVAGILRARGESGLASLYSAAARHALSHAQRTIGQA